MPYYITIDSKDRIYSTDTSSNFSVRLATDFFVNTCKFKNIIIPFSYYPYDANDTTTCTVVLNEGAADINAILPFPTTSWASANVANALATALTTYGTQTYTAVYNSITGKFTISAAANFSLKWGSSSAGLNFIFGFNNSTVSGANSYVSPNVMQPFGPPYLWVVSNALTSQTIDKCTSFAGSAQLGNSPDNIIIGSKSIFMIVPVNVAPLGVIEYADGSLTQREVIYSGDARRSDQTLRTIDIQIINPWTQKTINLNGVNMLLVVEVVGKA